MRIFILIFAFFFLCVNLAQAETVYVTHAPNVFMYSSTNSTDNTITELEKGAPVELLNTDKQKGYSYVQTEKGDKGWIKNEYLGQSQQQEKGNFFTNTWQRVKKSLERDKDHKAKKPQTTKAALNTTPQLDKKQQEKLLTKLRSMYSLSVPLVQKNLRKLQDQVSDLQQTLAPTVEKQQQQINKLQSQLRQLKYWVLMGIILALLLGFIIGKISARKQKKMFK
jgi:SH3 domain protein